MAPSCSSALARSTASGTSTPPDVQADIDAAPDPADRAAGRHHKGVATARRLPEFQCAGRAARGPPREPPRGAARGEGRRRHPAPRSGARDAVEPDDPALHAAAAVQQTLYAEVPFSSRRKARTTTSALFFDRISKFPRIINVSDISSRPSRSRKPDATIVAECVATTFVLQDGQAARKGKTTRAETAVDRSRTRGVHADHSFSSRSSRPPRPGAARPRGAGAGDAGASRRGAANRAPRARPAPATTPKAAAIRSSAWSAAATIRSTGDARRRASPDCSSARSRSRASSAAASGFIAMIQAPDNKTYIVRSGDRLFDGAVKTITQDGVVFSQDVNDPLSLVKQREVPKRSAPPKAAVNQPDTGKNRSDDRAQGHGTAPPHGGRSDVPRWPLGGIMLSAATRTRAPGRASRRRTTRSSSSPPSRSPTR